MPRIACPSAAALLAGFVILTSFAGACGGRVIVDHEATASGGDGGNGGGKVADAGTTDGGTCPDNTPPPSPTMPTKPGCYENQGSGWIQVPCSCELWITNTTPAAAKVQIELTMTPGATEPTLTGPLDVEIAFHDPDASWYAVWANQAGSGSAFLVTNHGGKTTVRMGTSSVTLAPVALSACRTRHAASTVSGALSSTLDMHATLSDEAGGAITTIDGTCEDIPPV